MNIHEYQAKELLKDYGIPVPRFLLVQDPASIPSLPFSFPVMVKAQVHTGGRGKAGGIKLLKNSKDLPAQIKTILGMTIITHQTGPQGKKVRKVILEQATGIEREFYISLLLDRENESLTFIGSPSGGMDIEEVARKNPEKILSLPIKPWRGPLPVHFNAMAKFLELPKGENLSKLLATVLKGIWKLLREKGASLVEINPLVLTKEGGLIALDAKINFDDNELPFHEDISRLYDPLEEEPLEVEAKKFNLSYIKMDGNVGCMVNGAGLAMATMDVISLVGERPANFLDVGGGATPERVKEAFRILLADSSVKAVLINIFGGIVRCDRVASGICQALEEMKVEAPVIVRLEGTNKEEGMRILKESSLKFHVVSDLAEAANKVKEAVSKNR